VFWKTKLVGLISFYRCLLASPFICFAGQRFSIAQIEELCENPAQHISNDQIHDIVVFIHRTDGLSKHMDSLTNIISLFKVKDTPFHVPLPIQAGNVWPASRFSEIFKLMFFILSMIIYSCIFCWPFLSYRHTELCAGSLDDDFDSLLSEIGKEISMADIITELGYGCTADIAHCKDVLALFEPLNDLGISKLLGAVVSSTLGLDEANNTYSTFISAFGNSQTSDSIQSTAWNINVLVDSINEIVSFCYLGLCCYCSSLMI
jgi:CCR4-NOT transcription complex subunit 1